MTLLIKAPLHFYPEVAYTVDIILQHLGLPYTIEKTERLNLDIQLNNKKNIIFELPFFRCKSVKNSNFALKTVTVASAPVASFVCLYM